MSVTTVIDIRKKRFKLNLNQIPNVILDNTFFEVDLPTSLTAGKNSIFIKTINLNVSKYPLKIELLSSDGNVIYTELSTYQNNNNQNIIITYIYPETKIGIAELTIVGTTYQNKLVKYNTKIYVDTYTPNITKLIFDTYPQIHLEKEFTSYKTITYDNNKDTTITNTNDCRYNYISTFKQSGKNASENEFNFDSKNDNQPIIGDNTQINYNNLERNRLKYISKRDNRITSKNKFTYDIIESPIITIENELIISGSNTTYFTNDLIGGEINITNIPQKIIPHYTYTHNDEDYYAIITNVLNEKTLQTSEPYKRKTENTVIPTKKIYSDYTYNNFNNGDITITYQDKATYNDSQQYINYVNINISEFKPIVGNVNKIKTYINSDSATNSSHKLINEHTLIPKNIFIDESNIIPNYSIGYFNDINHINNYWTSSGTIYYDNNVLLDAMILNGIDTHSTTVEVYEKHQYQVVMNITGRQNILIGDKSDLTINAVGNAFINEKQEIANITINEKQVIYKKLSFIVETDYNGLFGIEFKTNVGVWYISDLQIIPVAEFGFTPKHYEFKIPITPLWANDDVTLKFEFYNSNDESAEQTIEVKNVVFDYDTPTYIGGDFNLITGSLYVGSSLNSGIEIGQSNQGAIIRSLGYEGWKRATSHDKAGFMIWSGSVQPGGYDLDNYAGVGIEFNDGDKSSFQFKTQLDADTTGSLFSVRTDEFFLGREDTQFISGSGGLLEISSSFFQLSPAGEMFAQSGIIGGWEIRDGYLQSNNLDEYNTGSITIDSINSSIIFYPSNRIDNTHNLTITPNKQIIIIPEGGSPYYVYTPVMDFNLEGGQINFNGDYSNINLMGTQSSIILMGNQSRIKLQGDHANFILSGINSQYIKTNLGNDDHGGYKYESSFSSGKTTTGFKLRINNSEIAHGIYVDITNTTNAYGIYSNVDGSVNNWAGYFAGGDVMIENDLYVSGRITTNNPFAYESNVGVSGTFTTADSKTVTVNGGIITSIT